MFQITTLLLLRSPVGNMLGVNKTIWKVTVMQKHAWVIHSEAFVSFFAPRRSNNGVQIVPEDLMALSIVMPIPFLHKNSYCRCSSSPPSWSRLTARPSNRYLGSSRPSTRSCKTGCEGDLPPERLQPMWKIFRFVTPCKLKRAPTDVMGIPYVCSSRERAEVDLAYFADAMVIFISSPRLFLKSLNGI